MMSSRLMFLPHAAAGPERHDRGAFATPANERLDLVLSRLRRAAASVHGGSDDSIASASRFAQVASTPCMAARSALHRRGHRFRKDLLLRVGDVRVRPDIVYTKWKVAVFVDGCFLHGCPSHQHVPKSKPYYWVPKLAANVGRDRRVDAALAEMGWRVIRIWEHEPVPEAADSIDAALARQRD
jgi:DNA mismatch endonuclease (patch repair protein)